MLQILTAHPEENVKTLLQPWQLFLWILAGWVNRRQQDAIEYLITENRVLGERSLQSATVSFWTIIMWSATIKGSETA